jgi:phage-related protein
MACITITPPSFLTQAQGTLSQATDIMAALSGESCNVFGALGLQGVESGIQNVLGAVGNAMGAVNSAIAQIQNILNSVVDTALGTINQILSSITSAINQIANFAQNAISSITGLIDDAIGVLKERAKISEILACAGTLSQIGLLPSNVTKTIDQINGFLSSDTPVRDIANQMIADAKNSLTSKIQDTVGGIVGNIGNQVNSAQDLINVNVNQLASFSCAI